MPVRLREAREAMLDHGRPVSQQRFAERLGVSKRSVERYETHTAPKAPVLARIVEVTGRPVGFFFDAAAELAPAGGMDMAVELLARAVQVAVEQETRPLRERIELLEKQQRAEGWHGTTLTTTRRAA